MKNSEHIINGEFQSDKYPDTPRGLIPFKATDPMAQDILWTYAQRRRAVDTVFADDLEWVLRKAGYEPPARTIDHAELAREVVAAVFYESPTSEQIDDDDVERITTVITEYFTDHQPAHTAAPEGRFFLSHEAFNAVVDAEAEHRLTAAPATTEPVYKYGDKVIIGPNNVEAMEGPATILAPSAGGKWYFLSDKSEHPIPPKEDPQGVIGGQIVHSRFIQPADSLQA